MPTHPMHRNDHHVFPDLGQAEHFPAQPHKDFSYLFVAHCPGSRLGPALLFIAIIESVDVEF